MHERPDDAVEPVRPGAGPGVLRVNQWAGGRAERVRLGVRGAVPDLQRRLRAVQPDEPRGSCAGLYAPVALDQRDRREKLGANGRRELHAVRIPDIGLYLVQPEHDRGRAGDRGGGAGQVSIMYGVAATRGRNYTIKIGAGGAGVIGTYGVVGSSSAAFGVTAIAGGDGGPGTGNTGALGQIGASGGGSGSTGYPPFNRTSSYYTGFPGGADAVGNMGAGGGGWLGPGGASQACAGGTGGAGGAIAGFGLGIVGTGGAGGSNSTGCAGANGTNATSYGSGGGGGNSGGAGGNGGPGVVIVRFVAEACVCAAPY